MAEVVTEELKTQVLEFFKQKPMYTTKILERFENHPF